MKLKFSKPNEIPSEAVVYNFLIMNLHCFPRGPQIEENCTKNMKLTVFGLRNCHRFDILTKPFEKLRSLIIMVILGEEGRLA